MILLLSLLLSLQAQAWSVSDLTLPKDTAALTPTSEKMPTPTATTKKEPTAYTPPVRFDKRLKVDTPNTHYASYMSSKKWQAWSSKTKLTATLKKQGYRLQEKTQSKTNHVIKLIRTEDNKAFTIRAEKQKNATYLIQVLDNNNKLQPLKAFSWLG